jgi:hypothetical protein
MSLLMWYPLSTELDPDFLTWGPPWSRSYYLSSLLTKMDTYLNMSSMSSQAEMVVSTTVHELYCEGLFAGLFSLSEILCYVA